MAVYIPDGKTAGSRMQVYQPQFNQAWKTTFDVDNRDAETPYTITFRQTTGILVTQSTSQSITVGVNIGVEIKEILTINWWITVSNLDKLTIHNLVFTNNNRTLDNCCCWNSQTNLSGRCRIWH